MSFVTGHSIPQSNPPRPPRETLPTMYDLPSEYVGEPGLPDEFHEWQPQLLSRTLSLADYPRDEWFTGSDLNLYYDVHHPLWYKRPDWFLAVGVSRLYEQQDLRNSYVTWQERSAPYLVIEFLSPGTEAEDLGRFYNVESPAALEDFQEVDIQKEDIQKEDIQNAEGAAVSANGQDANGPERPPGKFTVYEERLRVPHYVVYNRRNQRLQYFQLMGGRYQEQPIEEGNPKLWIAELKIGLGIWDGRFEEIPCQWLRWCDEDGNWLLTDTERAEQAKEQERQAKEATLAQLLQAARNLLETGLPMDQVTNLLQLSPEQVAMLSSDP